MSVAPDVLKRARLAGVILAADEHRLRLKAPKEPPAQLIEFRAPYLSQHRNCCERALEASTQSGVAARRVL
jgi:hypothetical protein